MKGEQVVVGIDVAAARPCTAVAVGVGRAARVVEWREADDRHRGETRGLIEWIASLSPTAVAIDAPQSFNRHLLERSRLRVCDADLRHRGLPLYQVPAKGADVPSWIAVGFKYFRHLKKRGFETASEGVLPGAFGQAAALLEVYPHAAFATLLAEFQAAGQWPADRVLPKKTTREGARVRVELLRMVGVDWDLYFDHDSLDALGAAVTGWRFLQGRACGLGDPREGLLWLPVPRAELRDTYVPG
jgi:predicted nuclease with RNAse H fold